jgi:hypothetical protein
MHSPIVVVEEIVWPCRTVGLILRDDVGLGNVED